MAVKRQKSSNEMSDAELQKMSDALDDVLAEKASKKLRHFVPWAWDLYEGTPLVSNWHIDIIAEHIEAALNRQIRKLAITVSPRSSKTSIASICTPAFRWITAPEERFFLSSHKLDLCTTNLIKSRNIVNNPKYGDRYCNANSPTFSFKLSEDQSTKKKISNTSSGDINISSPDTGIIGNGGTIFLIDDIIDETMYKNERIRRERNNWVTDQLFGRSNDVNTDVKMAICQRLGDDDLIAHLFNKYKGDNGFFELCIPAEYAARKTYFSPLGEKWNDPRKTEGQLMDKKRLPLSYLETIDPVRRKTLFQQDPTGDGKGITLNSEDIRIVSQKPTKFDSMLIMWDLTFAASQASTSWNLGAVVGRKEDGFYVIDGIRGKLDIVGQMAAIKRLAQKYPDAEIGVEAKANGEAVMRLLSQEFPNIIPFRPSEWGGKAQADKEKRFGAFVPFIKNGQLYFYKPHTTDYTLDESYDPDHAINELVGFPLFSTNEWVDCVSYAGGYLSQKTNNNEIMLLGDEKDVKLTEDDYWYADKAARKYSDGYTEDTDIFIFTDSVPNTDDINGIQF
jgi:predicted phage terminase large subunit-like protein